jgi:pyruvate, water dikinase
MTSSDAWVVWFKDLPPKSSAIAGGKGASLGDIARAGLPVPPGFVVSAEGFRTFLESTGGVQVILNSMNGLDVHAETQLARAAENIRAFIFSKSLPDELEKVVRSAYNQFGNQVPVAVRSSAIGEDGEAASFAGQQESYLNVRSADAVIRHLHECWASLFTPRAIFYRAQKGSLQDSEMAVVVQKMVNADKSGVIFTTNPVQGRRDHMIIEAAYGLGEAVVSGKVTPDHYVVDRNNGSLVREHIAIQPTAFVYNEAGGTREIDLTEAQGSTRVLTHDELTRLLDLGLKLETHFGKPQDIEWSIEGNEIFLLQSRPITTL